MSTMTRSNITAGRVVTIHEMVRNRNAQLVVMPRLFISHAINCFDPST